jgi:acetyl esterase
MAAMGDPRDDGLADAGLAAYIIAIREAAAPPAREQGVAVVRAGSVRRAAARPAGPELPAIVDLTVAGDPDVPVRLYRSRLDPQPLLVYFHGGGWTIGDLDTHDRICRRLALAAGVAVLAVDYRLGPENPWPAAVDDALTVFRWARSEAPTLVGSPLVGVAGDSAGGNIAALCCLGLRDAGEPQPAAQVLIYPNTDLTFAQPSVKEKAIGWGLDSDDAIWFAEQWVSDPELRKNPRVSPLLEPDLSALAPAIVVTAEHDPLRDEGNVYAAALASAGVPVVHRVELGHVHGFLGLETVSDAAAEAATRLAVDISEVLRDRED